MGTLDYMAPEQADDSHDVDARADIYSLGATLYRLLTGQAPFAGPDRVSPVKKFKAVLLAPPPDVRERRPDATPELAGLIAHMLAKNPEDRPNSANDVARSLGDFCRGADLAALLARAERHAPRETDGGVGGPVPPISRDGGDSHGHRPEEQPSAGPKTSPRRKRILKTAVAALAVLLLAAAVFVIRLQTDKGELIIRSEDPDVQVLVKRGGEPVDDWQLQQGDNRTTVRSGSYEIVLLGNTDGLTVRDGEFTLTRGGQHVVTVERADPEPATSDVTDEMSERRRRFQEFMRSRESVQSRTPVPHRGMQPENQPAISHVQNGADAPPADVPQLRQYLAEQDERTDELNKRLNNLSPSHPLYKKLREQANVPQYGGVTYGGGEAHSADRAQTRSRR